MEHSWYYTGEWKNGESQNAGARRCTLKAELRKCVCSRSLISRSFFSVRGFLIVQTCPDVSVDPAITRKPSRYRRTSLELSMVWPSERPILFTNRKNRLREPGLGKLNRRHSRSYDEKRGRLHSAHRRLSWIRRVLSHVHCSGNNYCSCRMRKMRSWTPKRYARLYFQH